MRIVLLALLVAACNTPQPEAASLSSAAPTGTASGPSARPRPEDAHTPVLVRGRAIDPWTGAEVAVLASTEGLQFATPFTITGIEPLASPHRYRLGDAIIDTESRAVSPAAPAVVFDGPDRVRRMGLDGGVVWSTALPGNARSVRPPDLVVTDQLVIVAGWDKKTSFVIALHADGGAVQWRVSSVADRLFVHQDVVMSTDCSSLEPPAQRWLIGRRLGDGRELWRMELPLSADPDPLVEQGAVARVLARDGAAAMTYVFRPTDGEIVLELAEYVMAAVELAGATLYATDQRLASYDDTGRQLWQLPPLRRGDHAGFASGQSGELIAYTFSGHADSGVQLMRLEPHTGNVKWVTEAQPLGVSHSKYFHQAYARIFGQYVMVVSQGAFGDFVEVLDYATGDLLQRHRL